MPPIAGLTPLDWRALVEETIRRRKSEGLTRRDHAALAGVSVPTLAAFDRGETTLTLAKAFDILRVVGLLHEAPEADAQDRFVRAAMDRWRDLTAPLPPDSPARFPHGWYRFDYELVGSLARFDLAGFRKLLRLKAAKYSGWPPFMTIDRPDLQPTEVDEVIETWLAPHRWPDLEWPRPDAAHCDFWRADPVGRLMLLRGYQEDTQETFPPGRIFDTTLPIWRMAETLLHAERLAEAMAESPDADIVVRFRATYSGLSGRILKSWANPLVAFSPDAGPARSDEAILESETPARGLGGRLAQILHPLVASLYERFGVTGLSVRAVSEEIAAMTANRLP